MWSKRYGLINDFEKLLARHGTRILKFIFTSAPEEQLERFRQRLDDKSRQWKISESDYSECDLWPQYIKAYEDVLARRSTKRAPWYVILASHKWFRTLAILQIVADTMDEMGLKLPPAHVDTADIRRKFHAAEAQEQKADRSERAGRSKTGRHYG